VKRLALIWLLFAACGVAYAQMWPTPGPGRAPSGGGSACVSPDNLLASTAHLYIFADNSWVDAADPDDEGFGTDVALNFTGGVNQSDLVNCTTGCPAGSPTTTQFRLPLTSADFAVWNGGNLFKASQFGDNTVCAWLKPTGVDFDGTIGGSDTSNQDYNIALDLNGVNGEGLVRYAAFDGGDIDTANNQVSTNVWAHICTTLDANGAVNGTQTRNIFVNGVSAITPVDADDESPDISVSGLRARVAMFGAGSDLEFEVTQFAIWHSVLSAAQIHELCCCGINGEANPSTRDAICGGATCTSL